MVEINPKKATAAPHSPISQQPMESRRIVPGMRRTWSVSGSDRRSQSPLLIELMMEGATECRHAWPLSKLDEQFPKLNGYRSAL